MMKILLQCLLFLSCNALALSAEILAWKAPLSSVAPDGLNVPGVKRLEKPPESSPFFGPKDELWDIMAIAVKPDKERSSSPEWVVWNATTGRVVAKGSWVALSAVEPSFGDLNSVLQCRIKVDTYEVRSAGAPPDTSKPPNKSLSVVAREGQKVSAFNSEGEAFIRLESEATFTADQSVIDLRTLVSTSLSNGSVVQVDTSTTSKVGSPLWLARDFNGELGVDLMVTATLEFSDGTPLPEIILKQEGNDFVPFLFSRIHKHSDRIAIGENKKLVWVKGQQMDFSQIDPELNLIEAGDPFAVGIPSNAEAIKSKLTRVPEILAPHFHGYVYDPRDILIKNGIKISDADFVGYDLKNYSTFMYSSNHEELDRLDALLSLYAVLIPQSVIITSRGDGELRLISRNGQKASLTRTHSKTKSVNELVIEPTIGDSKTTIDIRLNYDEKIGEKSINSFDSSITLESGKFLKVLEKEKADGTKASNEIKAERLELE